MKEGLIAAAIVALVCGIIAAIAQSAYTHTNAYLHEKLLENCHARHAAEGRPDEPCRFRH